MEVTHSLRDIDLRWMNSLPQHLLADSYNTPPSPDPPAVTLMLGCYLSTSAQHSTLLLEAHFEAPRPGTVYTAVSLDQRLSYQQASGG